MPLMIFSEDFLLDGEPKHTGCAFRDGACNLNNDGKTWGVVDLSFKYVSEEERDEKAAKTLAHELGHLVIMYYSLNTNSPFPWYMIPGGQGLHVVFFSWELNIPKLLVVEEVGGTNFHGFIFLLAGKMKFL